MDYLPGRSERKPKGESAERGRIDGTGALTNDSSNMGKRRAVWNSVDVVMVNFTCQLTLAKGCPERWYNFYF